VREGTTGLSVRSRIGSSGSSLTGPEFARRDDDDRCGLAFDVGLDVFRPTDPNENHFGLLEVFKVGETTWPGSSTVAIDDQ
jgi:hypothetical protein